MRVRAVHLPGIVEAFERVCEECGSSSAGSLDSYRYSGFCCGSRRLQPRLLHRLDRQLSEAASACGRYNLDYDWLSHRLEPPITTWWPARVTCTTCRWSDLHHAVATYESWSGLLVKLDEWESTPPRLGVADRGPYKKWGDPVRRQWLYAIRFDEQRAGRGAEEF